MENENDQVSQKEKSFKQGFWKKSGKKGCALHKSETATQLNIEVDMQILVIDGDGAKVGRYTRRIEGKRRRLRKSCR